MLTRSGKTCPVCGSTDTASRISPSTTVYHCLHCKTVWHVLDDQEPVAAVGDQRHEPVPMQPCKYCGSADTAAASRTEYVVYIRCGACLQVWSVPKPGHEPLGS
jgi:translation initiation factor 2 beta subunit (eIF-2beta)/eIF-5